MKPGKGKQSFHLILSHDWFKAGDVITISSGNKALVKKRYTSIWWKSILNFIGFKFHTNGYKCKSLD